MLNWIIWNGTIFINMDLAWNNLQRLICHKYKPKKQKQKQLKCNDESTMKAIP